MLGCDLPNTLQIKVFKEQNANAIKMTLKEDENETREYIRASKDALARNYSEVEVREMSSASDPEQAKRITERCKVAQSVSHQQGV